LSFKASAAQTMILAAGFFGALGLVTLVLWKQGILREAFYWTITNHDITHLLCGRCLIQTLALDAD
jgi:hypothetical protein